MQHGAVASLACGSAWRTSGHRISGRYRDDASRRVQLQAYAVAAADARLDGHEPPQRTSVTFAYFGGDEVVEHREAVTDDWLVEARGRLAALVDLASTGPYEPQPSAACGSCDFLRFCPEGNQQEERGR